VIVHLGITSCYLHQSPVDPDSRHADIGFYADHSPFNTNT
jgi:hypothetical protein